MFCPTCGKEVSNGKFCSGCGESINSQGIYGSADVEATPNNTINKIHQFLSVKRNLYATGVALLALLIILNLTGIFEPESNKAKAVAESFVVAEWDIITGAGNENDKVILTQLIDPGEKGLFFFELGKLRNEAVRNGLTNYNYEMQSCFANGDSATANYKVELIATDGRKVEINRQVKLKKMKSQWIVVIDR